MTSAQRFTIVIASILGLGTSIDSSPSMPPHDDDRQLGVHATSADSIRAVLYPRHQATLSAEVSAKVVTVAREFGEKFEAADVLVRLDDAEYRVRRETAVAANESATRHLVRIEKLMQARTRERRAEAVVDAARANFATTQRLFEDQQASQLDLSAARRDLTVAVTDRELAASLANEEWINARQAVALGKGRVETATRQLDACTITAPWAGRIKRLLVHQHEWIEAGSSIVEILDDRVLVAKFLLPSSLFRAVTLGHPLELHLEETSTTVIGQVSHIAADLDPASVTFEVHATIDNRAGHLRAGMRGRVALRQFSQVAHSDVVDER